MFFFQSKRKLLASISLVKSLGGECSRVLKLVTTTSFNRAAKKLNPAQKADLDHVVQQIARDIGCGRAQAGDLKGVQTIQFKLTNHSCVLAYRVMDGGVVKLLASMRCDHGE